MNDARVLLLPGLYDSGPEHWQSLWEREHPSFERVVQRDWETPDRADWVATLQEAVAASDAPVILVAHSLACCLVAHWSAAQHGPVQGALLVAPSDVEADSYPPGTTGFAPMPLARLPFPSIVLASTDDLYISLDRAQQFAEAWGSRLEVLGPRGHINSASGLGSWVEGFGFLRELGGGDLSCGPPPPIRDRFLLGTEPQFPFLRRDVGLVVPPLPGDVVDALSIRF